MFIYKKNIDSLEKTLKIFEEFYRFTGLKLNKDKTEVIWLGKENRKGNLYGLRLVEKTIKVLGIWLSKDIMK